ncbi:DNA-binding transcriptional LysR family regulator [Paraburkholderia atlantica]|uniref:LysR family transcriptional regulator n=1 Tax=Paraburkholderia atlantica TaxID=2654982 RepID=UPI003D203BCF
MDITPPRTFLEVSASGSFISAAERLHLTQTAVSARIRTLEEQLGRRLFVRNKAGARLTTAGERFVGHATTLVQVWEQVRQHVALPPGREEGVSLGGELSLWHPLLADWLIRMHRECPQIALRAEVDCPMRLLDRVHEGSLDIAVLYNPVSRRIGLLSHRHRRAVFAGRPPAPRHGRAGILMVGLRGVRQTTGSQRYRPRPAGAAGRATADDEPRADHEVGSRPTVRGSRRRTDRGESVSQR